MRKHRYRGLMSTINYNICGDGYDANERANEIFEKAKRLIDKAYEQGRNNAIEEFAEALKNNIFIDIREYPTINEVAKQLKEQKNEKI